MHDAVVLGSTLKGLWRGADLDRKKVFAAGHALPVEVLGVVRATQVSIINLEVARDTRITLEDRPLIAGSEVGDAELGYIAIEFISFKRLFLKELVDLELRVPRRSSGNEGSKLHI